MKFLRRALPGGARSKHAAELSYWVDRVKEAPLEEGAHHYREFFLDNSGLRFEFFRGKRMLDIGCGPRGSLEWATEAAERVGLDPLAERYQRLHAQPHGMTYVTGNAEQIPYPDGHFDFVSSINSLDHVDDLDATLSEIQRVTKPRGSWLLLTDVNHEPTPTEPQNLGWDLLEHIRDGWVIVEHSDFERPGDNMFDNLRLGRQAFDHRDPRPRPGILRARLERQD